ncbi:hypothetical protein VTK26DRAFT_6456 [Humicola hyalothermophila]
MDLDQHPDPTHRSRTAEPDGEAGEDEEVKAEETSQDPADLSPASLASLASDDLHETRPNRWRGHPSTWLGWTERERRAWTALEHVRREDLAVHLYNAVGLRKGWRWVDDGLGRWGGGGEVAGREGKGTGKGKGKGRDRWVPPRSWTAWPMRAQEVPPDGLMPVVRDANEPWTLRRGRAGREEEFPGENLEEEISATVLRFARERLARRGLHGRAEDDDGKGGAEDGVMQPIEKGEEADGDTDAVMSAAAATASGGATTGGEERTDDSRSATPGQKRKRKRKQKGDSPTYTPVVSADDELSYSLLRPAARRIMGQLDDTLMILHNARVAGLGNMSESSASDEETDAEIAAVAKKESPKKPPTTPPRKSRGGRPRKVHIPLEGESEYEMQVRLARAGKRKLPPPPPAAETATSGEESGLSRRRSRGRRRGRSGRQPPALASSRKSSASGKASRSRTSSVSSSGAQREHKLDKWGLRDWRDVLGAAALAGFPPAVLARAAQRCSTLFREEMTLHTLHEQAATSDMAGIETARYVPGGSLPPSSDEDSDNDKAEELFQPRTISRQSSVRLTAASSPEREQDTPRSRRSRSSTPAPVHVCSYPDCPRAVKGFTKRTNLVRHLEEVHGEKRARQVATPVAEDSMDEMSGAVHVDGFLKPIKARKGWRTADRKTRQTRQSRRKKGEDEGSEELNWSC